MKMTRKRLLLFLAALLLLLHGHEREEPAFSPVRFPDSVLVLDAGHGGEDGGAVSPGGTVESQINLAVVLRMDAVLDLYGVEHILLRSSDRSLHDGHCRTLREKKISDLRNRVRTVENTPNAVLISVHQNTFTDAVHHGAQAFYRPDDSSRILAQTIQDTLRTQLDPGNSRAAAQIASSVYLMKHVTCPAVLVECGFLSHPAEEALLRTETYQAKLAMVLCASYMTYQETTKEGTPYESG